MPVPLRHLFEQVFGGTVSYDEMTSRYYPRVRKLRRNTMPGDIYSSAFASREWDAQARAGFRPTKVGFDLQMVDCSRRDGRPDPRVGDGRPQQPGQLRSGAKYDLNQNYLRQAKATGRARIYPGRRSPDRS